MKKLLTLLVIFIVFNSYLSAVETTPRINFNIGFGYRGTYVGAISEIDEVYDLDSGLALYFGLGVLLGQNDMFGLGVEAVLSSSFRTYPFPFGGLGLQLRGYFTVVPIEKLSITTFLGANLRLKEDSGEYYYTYDYYYYDTHYEYTDYYDGDATDTQADPVFGIRVTFFKVYAEYAMTLNGDFTEILRHEFGLGLMFDININN